MSDFPHPVLNEKISSVYTLVLRLGGFMVFSCALTLNAKCHLVTFPTALIALRELFSFVHDSIMSM